MPPDTDWRYWLLLAGRGFGKTRTIVEYAKMRATAKTSRGAIVASTAADARDIIVLGESGFLNTSTGITYEPSKRRLVWDNNGSTATLFSAEEPDRLRGHQFHWAIADELAAWRHPETWNMLLFGMRLGDNPQVAIATTPRPTKIIRQLMSDEHTAVVRGTTYENRDNLAPAFFDSIIKQYEGTRLGRQELDAEILEDVPGALWTQQLLDEERVLVAPDLVRIVVGFDPAASNNESSDESGIITAGIDVADEGYVLDDSSVAGSVDERLTALISTYHRHSADLIVVEANNGGDWLPHAIRGKDSTVNVRTVHASRGKHTRAEPVSGMYEQKRIHHVGMFAELEDQLCTWVPGESSPDRMDALVWAFTELLVGGTTWLI